MHIKYFSIILWHRHVTESDLTVEDWHASTSRQEIQYTPCTVSNRNIEERKIIIEGEWWRLSMWRTSETICIIKRISSAVWNWDAERAPCDTFSWSDEQLATTYCAASRRIDNSPRLVSADRHNSNQRPPSISALCKGCLTHASMQHRRSIAEPLCQSLIEKLQPARSVRLSVDPSMGSGQRRLISCEISVQSRRAALI